MKLPVCLPSNILFVFLIINVITFINNIMFVNINKFINIITFMVVCAFFVVEFFGFLVFWSNSFVLNHLSSAPEKKPTRLDIAKETRKELARDIKVAKEKDSRDKLAEKPKKSPVVSGKSSRSNAKIPESGKEGYSKVVVTGSAAKTGVLKGPPCTIPDILTHIGEESGG